MAFTIRLTAAFEEPTADAISSSAAPDRDARSAPDSTSRAPICIALTASSVPCWTSPISVAISFVARDERSSATTAKPLPCSPARAASMAALSARRFVCSAMSSIVSTMSPIRSPLAPSSVTLTAAPSTASLIRAMPSTVWRTVSAPLLAASPAAAPRLWTSADAYDAERMERVISSTAAACASTLRAVSEAPPRTCSMTIRRSPTAADVSVEARA